jgi:D-beta-D-heptose 7-phosphate kinase/D-beta-D-heptose 1-phosphate adenosyltransferase
VKPEFTETRKSKICVSGGMDPLHVGHVRMIQDAARYGDVYVILNTDSWLVRKKGYYLQPWEQRAEILRAIKGVKDVVIAKDDDGTVCANLREIYPDYFANGGDRTESNTPELDLCINMEIKSLFNVGGGKVESSQEIIRRIVNAVKEA